MMTTKYRNKRLLDDIIALGQTCWSSQQCQLIKFKDHHCSILTVDCFNQPLPEREGVGLARKIGVDLAVYLYSVGVVKQNLDRLNRCRCFITE